jgi:putative spermidine/putrescine transport system substrate-binding protein
MADFFNTKKFPGKRGMRKTPKANLEMALIADGVANKDVYEMLATDAGVDRAFAKLDTIKDHVVWWEAGAQPPQLLADGEVAMTTAYNGRIFNAIAEENKPLKSFGTVKCLTSTCSSSSKRCCEQESGNGVHLVCHRNQAVG